MLNFGFKSTHRLILCSHSFETVCQQTSQTFCFEEEHTLCSFKYPHAISLQRPLPLGAAVTAGTEAFLSISSSLIAKRLKLPPRVANLMTDHVEKGNAITNKEIYFQEQ